MGRPSKGSPRFTREVRSSSGTDAQVLDSLAVSVDFLRVIGVSPALGRDFGDEHRTSSGPSAVILSHGFWRDYLGANPSAIGATLTLKTEPPHTILGDLGPELELVGQSPMLVPLHEDQLAMEDRTFYNYWLIGRLASGATPGAATRELSALVSRIAVEDPRLGGWSVLVERVDEISVAAVRPLLIAIACAVALVVFAGATNLACLNLVRTLGRSRELRIRAAIEDERERDREAGPRRVGRLAIAGAALGLVLGLGLLRWLGGIVPASIPIPGSAAVVSAVRGVYDFPVVLSSLVVAFLLWFLMSLPFNPLTRAMRGLRVVVAAELASATVLLVGAGLLSRAADRLLAVDPGIDRKVS